MPTTTQPGNAPGSSFLGVVRESQAAVIDVLRVWSDIGQQLTRNLGLPVTGVAGAVDRAFDVAEQTLAAQRQLALTLAGVATRQVETAVDTVAETIDTSVEAAGTTVEVVDGAVRERVQQVEAELKDSRERVEPPQAGRGDGPKVALPEQDHRPDGRTYEERTVEELRERAGELQLEGRSSMNKEELIVALRNHRKSRSAKREAPKQDRPTDRRTYEERSIEELRERARGLEIEGRSTMTKEELIAALRQQAK
jgi:hypothetical protein